MDAYNDGRCAGSAIGLVDAGGTIDLLLVTDADDRRQPALLLSTALHR